MRITSKGQVTIPQAIRERFGLLPDTEVDFRLDSQGVRLVKRRGKSRRGRGVSVTSRLRASATVQMTTDQILALTRTR